MPHPTTAVLDNLIHRNEIPPTAALFVDAGETGPGYPHFGGTDNRSIEYDPRKPLRVWHQSGERDVDVIFGNIPLANMEMDAALRYRHYDSLFEYGTIDLGEITSTLPGGVLGL